MIHGLTGPLAPWEPFDPPDDWIPCCMSSAVGGPQDCTCWVAVFDREQQEPQPGCSTERATLCADCAYRKNSPERAEPDEAEFLFDLADCGEPFFCHQGMRRVIEWRHPDGRVVAGDPRDYRPQIPADGFPRRADGTCADMCGGWAARRKAVA